ncbi:uncharacterized protein DS421_1g14950 [Arachis hypogaea]|nr:uncharacterized protein DS421_1g14950 [Arachis hypogaea]
MDGYLEQIKRNKELLSKEDENHWVDVKEEVEEQEEEATVSSEFSVKKEEVVEIFEPKPAYIQKPLEMTKEYENSQPPQIPLNQKLSTLKYVIEGYEEEMKKSWEEQQTSSMKELLSQMLSAKEEVKEQENKTPIITQQPSLKSKEVKATNKSTNPTPDPASKLNQAINKRKLAEERPRQATIAESSSPLRSFLLTNWKKRKKVKNNMSS